MEPARFIKKQQGYKGRKKGAQPYEICCPHCKEGSGTLHRYGDDNQQKELNKIAGLDGDKAMFWKCSKCYGEFFDDEVERHYYKTGIFTGDDGETVFMPLTKNYLAKRKAARTSGKKRPRGLSSKDIKILRRLKK